MFKKYFSLKDCKLHSDELDSKRDILVNFNQLSEIKTKTDTKNK